MLKIWIYVLQTLLYNVGWSGNSAHQIETRAYRGCDVWQIAADCCSVDLILYDVIALPA